MRSGQDRVHALLLALVASLALNSYVAARALSSVRLDEVVPRAQSAWGRLFGSTFERSFDASLAWGAPAQLALARTDPVWRRRALAATEAGYSHGGWNGANTALDPVFDARVGQVQWVAAHADDEAVLARVRTLLALYEAQAADPARCYEWASGRLDARQMPALREALKADKAAWAAAYESGWRALASGDAAWLRPPEHATTIGERMWHADPQWTVDEQHVMENYGDPAIANTVRRAFWCAAEAKHLRKVLSLPAAEAGWVMRASWAGGITWNKQ